EKGVDFSFKKTFSFGQKSQVYRQCLLFKDMRLCRHLFHVKKSFDRFPVGGLTSTSRGLRIAGTSADPFFGAGAACCLLSERMLFGSVFQATLHRRGSENEE